RAPNALICSILGELHSHCHEKLEFNESHLPKLKPSYSYILFLIFNLSFISFCYSLVFTPKILMSFVLEKNIISFRDCMTQLFFLPIFCELRELCTYSHSIGSLCGHLSAIAVQDLLICCLLIFGFYLMGFANAIAHTRCMIRLKFCDSKIINHYMCDIFPLLQLSCLSTYVNELMISVGVRTAIILFCLIILVSYALIRSNIIHVSSGKGRSKAFRTCGSHIITVSLFYGSGLLLAYVKLSSAGTASQGKFFSVFCSLLMPMLNPLIYSLRNKDGKLAMPHMMQMTVKNNSSVSEFILMGLTDQLELQLPLFVLFLVNYTATVMGNLSLMNLICLNSNLHTPMYFFIFNLSFIDFCYSLVFTPKMLMSFLLEKNTISFGGCMTQLFFFLFFVNSESYVLTAMAYDRYVAICQPLLYNVVMSPKICFLLIFGTYMMGLVSALFHTGFMIGLRFCDSNIINHYMCDIFPLLRLSCSDTYVNERVHSIVLSFLCCLIIFISYAMILFNIIHMSSGKGWSKALGTCGSHIITVCLFYVTGLLAYVKPSSAETVGQGKIFSVFYTFLVPMLNPLIYSLRNKDVKLAVKKTWKRFTG
ncbi:hypothetical protein U0070_014713, partial [Myodes glareolus]